LQTEPAKTPNAIPSSTGAQSSTTPLWFPISSVNNSEYSESDNTVYLNGGEIADADPASFLIFERPDGEGPRYFSKDANHVFDGSNIVAGADPATFTPLYNAAGWFTCFAKDIHHVYEAYFGGVSIVAGADPTTFVILSRSDSFEPYTKDKNHIYTLSGVLTAADPASFSVIYENPDQRLTYAKDRSHVFIGDSIIPDADPVTFMPFNESYYAKDQTYVFFGGNIITGADPATFTAVEEPVVQSFTLQNPPTCGENCHDAQDRNHQYFEGQIMQ
jgi:DKNYY family